MNRVHILIIAVVMSAQGRAAVLAQDSPKPRPQPTVTESAEALGQKLRADAAAGDPAAADALGRFNEIAGRYEDAVSWYQQAADKGFTDAQAGLGRLYATGQGVPQDFVKAYTYSRPAADAGDPLAQLVLATMNILGQGRPVNDREALQWARRAAEQDCEKKFRVVSVCAQAQSILGAAYFEGKGVPQDYLMAYMWANLAASGLSDAVTRVRAVTVRDDAAKRMTSDQIAEGQRLAREWKPTAPK